MLILEEHHRDIGAPATHRLLQGVPTGGILEGDIGAGAGESAGGEYVVETDSKVEGSFTVRIVAAVKHGGDLVGDSLLG